MATARIKPGAKKKGADSEGEVQRVYRQIFEWLISAELRPGEFLSEVDLAGRCKTSRTPVREALSRLAQDRWLVLMRRRGWMVRLISVRDIIEMYEYRKLLECFAAERVAQSITHDQLAELRQILLPEDNKDSLLSDILKANERFHLRLAELAGNSRIVAELSLTLSYSRRLDTLCTQTVPGWLGHREILAALAEHRRDSAREAMSTHIDGTSDKIVKLFSA